MSSNPQAPRPTINGNNANVDSMLAKLNQRLQTLANGMGVPPDDAGTKANAALRANTVLAVTSSHIDGLALAHSVMDGIEATLGTPPSGS